MNQRSKIADRILVIAYGNPLRCDDGVAWQAAEEIRRKLPSLTVVCVHQLTPELAEDASGASTIIFIDATRNGEPGEVLCEAVSRDYTSMNFSHNLTPGHVVALCNQLYGAEPRAFAVSISGENFNHGDAVSNAALRALPLVVDEVSKLIKGIAEAGCSRQ